MRIIFKLVTVLVVSVNETWLVVCRYMVTHLMGADLNNIVKTQRLSDDHVQFLVYQILRGLKASTQTHTWTEQGVKYSIEVSSSINTGVETTRSHLAD